MRTHFVLTLALVGLVACQSGTLGNTDSGGSGGTGGTGGGAGGSGGSTGGSGGSTGGTGGTVAGRPVADAGDDRSTSAGGSTFLLGSGSYDPDGDPLTYAWRQLSGTPVTIVEPSVMTTTFVAPMSTEDLVFELTVSDGVLTSLPDTVVITVIGYSGDRADVFGTPNDPPYPTLAADSPRELVLSGDTLVIADRTGGVLMADVSEPLTADIVGSFPEPSDAVEVAWPTVFSLSYDSFDEGDLVVLDATDPTSPVEIGRRVFASTSLEDFDGNGTLTAIVISGRDVAILDSSLSGMRALSEIDVTSPYRVRFAGGNLLIGTGLGEVYIYDLTDPAAPALIGTYPGDGTDFYLMAAAGSFAYGFDNGLLEILDISDPSAPLMRGSVTTTIFGTIAVAGDVVCASRGSDGIGIIDVSDPDAPVEAAVYPTTGSVEHVAAAGSRCYGRQFMELMVLDVSTPATPTQIGTMSLNLRDILADGNTLYVAISDQVEIFDVTDPADIQSLGSVQLPGSPSLLRLSGSTLYAESDAEGVFVIDVGDASAPQLLNEHVLPQPLVDIELVGTWLLGAFAGPASSEGMHVYDVADPTAPALVTAYRASGTFKIVAGDGDDTVYLHRYTDGIERIDLGTPSAPVSLDLRDTWCTSSTVEVVGTTFYCGDTSYLEGYDFSVSPPDQMSFSSLSNIDALDYVDPHLVMGDDWGQLLALPETDLSGRVAWQRRLDEGPHALVVGPSTAYAAVAGQGVVLTDFEVDQGVDAVGELNIGQWPITMMEPVAGRLYVLTWDRFDIYDISTATPALLGSVSHGGFGVDYFALDGGHAYLPDLDGLFVIDVSDASSPAQVGRYDAGEAGVRVAASQGRVYLTTASAVLRLNVSNPTAPALAGSFALANAGWLAAYGDVAYVNSTNLRVIDFANAAGPTETTTFAGIRPRVNGPYLLTTTIAGIEIRDLADPTAPALLGARAFELGWPVDVGAEGSTVVGYSVGGDARTRVWVVDAGAPASPVLGAYFGILNDILYDAVVANGRIWVAMQRSGDFDFYLVAYPTMAGAVSVAPTVPGPVSPSATTTFDVTWEEHDAGHLQNVYCTATAGSCTTTATDPIARTAQVSWEAPATAGDQELAVSVGHHELSMVGRLVVSVQ